MDAFIISLLLAVVVMFIIDMNIEFRRYMKSLTPEERKEVEEEIRAEMWW